MARTNVDNMEVIYWCALCAELHAQQEDTEECVMRTAWHVVDHKRVRVGFCNGVHRKEGMPHVKSPIKL